MAWTWLPEHEETFEKMKKTLTSKTMVKPFEEGLQTILMTDASRLFGLGFCLVQLQPDKSYSMIQCGSTSLTDAQGRYATIELELLAIQWAIQKCEYFLRGMPTFDVWTDHRPLVGFFKKDLHLIDNPRLMRIREKIVDYTFKTHYVPGKTHFIADALSRAPVFNPEAEEFNIMDATALLVHEEPDIQLSLIHI